MKGIYVSPDSVQANKDAEILKTPLELVSECLEEYGETQDKELLVKAIHYLTVEYVGNEVPVLG